MTINCFFELSFNIHNQITGINKDYALKNPANYNKWNHFFGLYLGFDNKDYTFNAARLNGQVTGLLWNTQGDDAQRKYDYSYDNANRLVNAAYKEQSAPGNGWSNGNMDFSVSGSSGQITYDLKGNLLTMLQKGVMPGSSSPLTIDDLHYAYNAYSNQLQSVTDQMTTTNLNGQFGDFKDGTNAPGTADYVYDANGNVVVDLNKNVQSLNGGAAGSSGISYNFLDKPEQINIVGKIRTTLYLKGSQKFVQNLIRINRNLSVKISIMVFKTYLSNHSCSLLMNILIKEFTSITNRLTFLFAWAIFTCFFH